MNHNWQAHLCEDNAPLCQTCLVLCLIHGQVGLWFNQSCHPICVQPLRKGPQPGDLGDLEGALAC